jgi:AcrR family transcriptional regulator
MPKVSDEHKTQVKGTIMRAAIKNFSKTGYAATKMDDIAKTADVSKGTLYLYFESKEKLFQSICKQNQQILSENQMNMFMNKNRIRKDIGDFYDNFTQAVKDTQKVRIEALAESIHNTKLRKIIQTNRKEIESSVEALFKEMRKNGFFTKNVDIPSIASGAIGLFDGLVVSDIVGVNHNENKKAWIDTMMAILEGTGIKK